MAEANTCETGLPLFSYQYLLLPFWPRRVDLPGIRCYHGFSPPGTYFYNIGPFPPHRRGSLLPPYLGLAKWVSVSPVPWICLCYEAQLRPKAPIRDGNQGLQLSKKRTLEPNLQCTNEILEVDDIEEKIDFKSDNFQSSFKDCSIKENIQTQNSPCPFCADLLPNPLPEKIHLLLRKIASQNGTPTSEDRLTFCEIHQAETTIVTNGIQKGYPMQIDFDLLETQIFQMKDELKASTPIALIALFEVLRPGYYGSHGLNIISDAHSKLFLDINLLTYDLDRGGLELELAQEIIENSADFGDYVYSE
ncbi:hypothetical protein C2G38_2208424 [Gigaspora rosea]|uniref:Restriction of telomere capping protein 4 n=1 Tax=Gigaspora rosea TaxID=44941 RepID=A0A397UK64_9GLOM|nr:hypothetical protein C2G38_2208424 [Gigaspora rosea]